MLGLYGFYVWRCLWMAKSRWIAWSGTAGLCCVSLALTAEGVVVHEILARKKVLTQGAGSLACRSWLTCTALHVNGVLL